jgi:hypothetical protein
MICLASAFSSERPTIKAGETSSGWGLFVVGNEVSFFPSGIKMIVGHKVVREVRDNRITHCPSMHG